MKLTRDMFEPYIDLNKGVGEYKWARVRKSTIFELSSNAQEETFGYIDTQNDTTEVTSYQPQLPLESVPESTDEVYAFMQKYLFDFPLGSDTQVPFLLKYPIIENGEVDQTKRNAIIFDEAVVSNLALNTVDQKATWTEMLNGTPKRGTMPITTGSEDDFTFTEAGKEPTVQTFSAPKTTKKADEE